MVRQGAKGRQVHPRARAHFWEIGGGVSGAVCTFYGYNTSKRMTTKLVVRLQGNNTEDGAVLTKVLGALLFPHFWP